MINDLGLSNSITIMAAFITLCSAFIALWGYVSSLRPYIYIYLDLGVHSKMDIMFNIVNNGTVGAKNLVISLDDGNNIYRFDEQTAHDRKPYLSDDGQDMSFKLPIFHKDEIIPPNFRYENFLGRAAGHPGNELFTKPFVLTITYKSSLPLINKIPFIGQFKEKFLLNPSMFKDLVGSNSKEIIDIELKTTTGKISGQATRRYAN